MAKVKALLLATIIALLAFAFLPSFSVINTYAIIKTGAHGHIVIHSIPERILVEKDNETPTQAPQHIFCTMHHSVDMKVKKEPNKQNNPYTPQFIYAGDISSSPLNYEELLSRSSVTVVLPKIAENKRMGVYTQKIHEIESNIK
jgi:hypothetical protein